MNAPAIEVFLARLYTDDALRGRFLAAPADVARGAGLDDDAVQALLRIDRQGLELAAESYSHKRTAHEGKHRGALLRRLRLLLIPKRLS